MDKQPTYIAVGKKKKAAVGKTKPKPAKPEEREYPPELE